MVFYMTNWYCVKMSGEKLKFTFKNIGPIKKKSTIENSNITMLYGFPNSGKSFILRSLYSSLCLQDPKMKGLIENICNNNMNNLLVQSIRDELNQLVMNLGKIIDVNNKISNALMKEDLTSISEELLEDISTFVGNELLSEFHLEHSDKEIKYSFEEDIIIPIGTGKLNKYLENSLVSFLTSLIGSKSFKNLYINDQKIIELFRYELDNLTYDTIEDTFALDNFGSIFTTRTMLRDRFQLKIHYLVKEISEEYCSIKIDGILSLRKELRRAKIKALKNLRTTQINRSLILEKIANVIKNEKMSRPPIYQIREIPRALSWRISKKIVVPFLDRIKSLMENTANIEGVRFIPFGRTPLINYAQDEQPELFIPDDIDLIGDPTHSIYSNFIEWIKYSQRRLSKQSDFKLDTTELLQGGITYDDLSRHLLYRDNDETAVDIRYASAMANEVSGIILMAMSMSKGIIIVEEPESQLHPASQIIMALSLIALSSFDYRIVLSTHSNIIGQVFYLVHKYKPSPQKIQTLIDNIMNVEKIGNEKIETSELAKQVYNSMKECKFDSYYVERIKGVKRINLNEFEKGIPGITDEVLMKLLNWTVTLVD